MAEPVPPEPSGPRRAAELQIERGPVGEDRIELTVSGELDMHTAPRLREVLTGEVADGRRHLVLECADLRFVDSTGLGVLVTAHKRASEQGGGVEIRNPSRILTKLLDITKLDKVFLRP